MSSTSRPRSRSDDRQQRQDDVAVHVGPVGGDRQAAVGVAVVGDAQVGLLGDHGVPQPGQVGRADTGVDVQPVRAAADDDDLGAGPAVHLGRELGGGAVGAVDDHPQPARAGSGWRPAGGPDSAGRRRRRAGSGRPPRRWAAEPGRPSAASMASSTASSSLSPPAAKILMPLSGIALCEAEMTTPRSAPRSAVRKATAGVGSTPSSSTSTPAEARPAATAASSISPLARGSRPRTASGRLGLACRAAWPRPATRRRRPPGRPATGSGAGDARPRRSPSTCAAAVARRRASAGVRSALARPRTPSVPNSRPTSGGQRFEYWGALRAFFRPYFLRSVARASRVRKPAFFSGGRSVSSSSISARAMASRSAPAWPVTPPPCSRAMTS